MEKFMMQSSASLRGLTWQELEIIAAPEVADELDAFLTSCQLGGWVVEAEEPQLRWIVYLPCTEKWEDRLSLIVNGVRAVGGECHTRGSIVDEDWANCWKQFYHPMRFGRHIVVCPSWEEFIPEEGDKVITLDPGMAFGTGAHASTAMCLEMMERVYSDGVPDSVLDVGTGSGILAVAARLLGSTCITASDSDPVAVKAARKNFAANNLTSHCDLFEYVGVPLEKGRFPLVCANLVASLLCRLASDLLKVVLPGGHLIVSGIVQERAEEVIEAFADEGAEVADRIDKDDWVCLLLKNK
ncbi:MAG: 50S ribosomal protein L11 methyltransferase [Candidatus Bruticola sp.]